MCWHLSFLDPKHNDCAFYDTQSIDSQSNNARFMQKLSKNAEIMQTKLCARHHVESGSVFID